MLISRDVPLELGQSLLVSVVWKMVRQPWEQGSSEGRRNGGLRAWAALSRHRVVQGVSGPQGHHCQAGESICARHSRKRGEGLDNSQCHGSPVLMQCMLQMGKGKLRPAPLPVAPALSQVEQGDMG